ncbi:MAG: peptide chain release factor N(5)-glutamine methyltransferase [Clostridia bacterium]|nr:peptide chain release factor N(5)-glutamine methyltransferase [Clostridia bacterium]
MTDKQYLEKYLEPSKLEEGLKRLESGEPLQYIIGNVNFCGNKIDVNSKVLIPRFETELLVSKTIDYIKHYFNKTVKIIDLGTGSGAIAITLKKNISCAVDAIDISDGALETARKNAVKNNVDINFFESDMLDSVTDKYDVIISNPPYIAYNEEIEDIVKDNEPAIALFAENNGLEFYERILSNASKHINNKAIIAFETGRYQGKAINEIAKSYFPNAKVSIEKDFPGEDRFVFIFINL